MAQYKVPQDVEADDKLLGPFSFRQFVYLLVSGGLVALAVGLFQLFPLLAIIPIPPILLFVALALPLKKDQPMETYLAAIVSYYLKPHTRLWTPGQKESTIQITAPKIVEDSRTRSITGEEATHRLSFLADIVDTGGYAIKGAGSSPMREDLVAEANTAVDMFEGNHFDNLSNVIQRDENARHAEVVREMQEAIDATENIAISNAKLEKRFAEMRPSVVVSSTTGQATMTMPVTREEIFNSPTVILPNSPVVEKPVEKSNRVNRNSVEKASTTPPKPSIIELANNDAFSVQTIAKEANRINRKDEGEVFISLH
ncbi:PrgI family protein [Candidatus Saccharibacteria bacterium]|nr:PrgI family protein [Candidatus Saccharibacteria bacterium]